MKSGKRFIVGEFSAIPVSANSADLIIDYQGSKYAKAEGRYLLSTRTADSSKFTKAYIAIDANNNKIYDPDETLVGKAKIEASELKEFFEDFGRMDDLELGKIKINPETGKFKLLYENEVIGVGKVFSPGDYFDAI